MQPIASEPVAPPEPWVGLSLAARLAELSQGAIHRAGKRGAIRTKQIAGRTLYHRASVEKYAAKRAVRRAA